MASLEATVSRSGPRTGFSLGAILAFVCLGQFMVFIDVSIVNLALPSIQRGLGMSDISLNYVVTAYATVLGGFLLLGGRLADTLGRRRVLRAGLVVFAAASAVAGLAQTGGVLIAARGLQGLGSALITPAALSILTTTFAEGPQRNRALGVWGSLAGIATIAYDGLAAQLAAAGGDPALIRDAQAAANHRAFLASACAGLAALLIAVVLMPRGTTSAAPRATSDARSAQAGSPSSTVRPTAPAAPPHTGPPGERRRAGRATSR